MFRTRLLSGIILLAAAFAAIWAGGAVLAAVLCAISLIAFYELVKAIGVHTEGKRINALEALGYLSIVLYYAALYIGMYLKKYDKAVMYGILAFGVVIALLLYLFCYVFCFPAFRADAVMGAFFSFVYAPVFLSFLYMIREGWNHGLYLIWLVFLCSWGSDTCAYCVGVLFGKHKMAPKLSPKKSVEGGIGGIAGAAILFGLYTYFVVNPFSAEQLHWGGAMCLGAVGALVSMIGDLAASAIKRDHAIKDYGKLIPGHGGIMDRFDSVIVAAPLIFLGLILIG